MNWTDIKNNKEFTQIFCMISPMVFPDPSTSLYGYIYKFMKTIEAKGDIKKFISDTIDFRSEHILKFQEDKIKKTPQAYIASIAEILLSSLDIYYYGGNTKGIESIKNCFSLIEKNSSNLSILDEAVDKTSVFENWPIPDENFSSKEEIKEGDKYPLRNLILLLAQQIRENGTTKEAVIADITLLSILTNFLPGPLTSLVSTLLITEDYVEQKWNKENPDILLSNLVNSFKEFKNSINHSNITGNSVGKGVEVCSNLVQYLDYLTNHISPEDETAKMVEKIKEKLNGI